MLQKQTHFSQNSFTHVALRQPRPVESSYGSDFQSTTLDHIRLDLSGFDCIYVSVTSKIRIKKDEMVEAGVKYG